MSTKVIQEGDSTIVEVVCDNCFKEDEATGDDFYHCIRQLKQSGWKCWQDAGTNKWLHFCCYDCKKEYYKEWYAERKRKK